MGDIGEKVAGVIPAFFYDLISRIVPGATVLWLLVTLCLPGSGALASINLSDASGLLIAMGFSYILALLLTPFGALIGLIFWYFLSGLNSFTILSSVDLWKQIDNLDLEEQHEAALALGKMAAEMTLIENLLAGVLGLLILSACNGSEHLGLLAVLAAFCMLSVVFRKAVLGGRAHALPNFPDKPRRGIRWRGAGRESSSRDQSPNPTAPADQKASLFRPPSSITLGARVTASVDSTETFHMIHTSPYLKVDRLGDVIAALQFLGQYDDYKLTVREWNEKIASPPRSVGELKSWGMIFSEHPEFFRTNDDGHVSLVWRRAVKRTSEGDRPPLEPGTIAKLIDTAVELYSSAVEALRADETKQLQATQDRRWRLQLVVSILTALLAFAGVVLAAWLKVSTV